MTGQTHTSWDGRGESSPRQAPTDDVRLNFPLSVGKTWTNEYDFADSRGTPRHAVARHRVVGWEDVKVPAGQFRAMRVENEVSSRDTGTDARPATLKDTDWYAPAVRNSVREVIEFDNGDRTDNVRLSFVLRAALRAARLDTKAPDCRPEYPAAALDQGLTGTTNVRLVVAADGRVRNAEITHSSGPSLEHRLMDRATLAAFTSCPFRPGVDGSGRPVGGTFDLSYTWQPRPASPGASAPGAGHAAPMNHPRMRST